MRNSLSRNVNYALKGDARTYGFVAQDAMDLPPALLRGNQFRFLQPKARQISIQEPILRSALPIVHTQNQNPGIDVEPQQWAMVYYQ